ncbi:MAG: hypothetical protein O7B24_06270 [Alphaproteobacteria bacterium]|nr:hypothetical protein [Alphaproteobacteria bacterium]
MVEANFLPPLASISAYAVLRDRPGFLCGPSRSTPRNIHCDRQQAVLSIPHRVGQNRRLGKVKQSNARRVN